MFMYVSVHVIIPILFDLISASFVLLDFKISKCNERLLEIRVKLNLLFKENHTSLCLYFICNINMVQHLKNSASNLYCAMRNY